jgi:long-chain acyl-CoA synthetase
MSDAPMALLERLAGHARSKPDAPAVRTASESSIRTVTYGELAGAVAAFAAEVIRHVPAGGVVGIAAGSGAEFAAAYLGTLHAGCVVHPVPRNSTASELTAFLKTTGAGLLVGDSEAFRAAQWLPRVSIESVLGLTGSAPAASPDLDAPGLYLPSSGTTGLPKIAVRSRRSLDAVAANVALAARLQPEDVVLAAVPMSHSYGLENGLLGPIWAGSCVHVVERSGSFDTGELPAELDRGGVTVFPAVPFMVDVLAKLAPEGGLRTRLRLVYTAGSPLPRGVAEEFSRRYGIGVGQLYGATEVGSVTFAEPGANSDSSCVGRPLRGVSILILDSESADVSRPAPAGDEGQVAIRAESMLSHYLGGGDRNDPAFLGDYFLTGDLGRIDERGELTITGRLKLLIDVGGFKVNPLEVERTLLEHPSVGEVVVLPVKVTETVWRLRALIAPRSGSVPIDELRAFARERLSPHKVPRIFEVVSCLPKSATGKVLRRELEGAT